MSDAGGGAGLNPGGRLSPTPPANGRPELVRWKVKRLGVPHLIPAYLPKGKTNTAVSPHGVRLTPCPPHQLGVLHPSGTLVSSTTKSILPGIRSIRAYFTRYTNKYNAGNLPPATAATTATTAREATATRETTPARTARRGKASIDGTVEAALQ